MMQFLFTHTPLAYFVASFWRDEAFSYLMARLPVHSLLWSTAQDANPPLYYLLLKLWMGVFGSSEVALRSLSLIFFWMTLYVAFLIMRDVYKLGTKKSSAYLLLFVINPFLHYYAFEARMYSMMAFIATLLFYALMTKRYGMYASIALIAVYTHYFLFLIILLQIAFLFFTISQSHRSEFVLPLVKALVWFVPWVLILIVAKPPLGGSFWIQRTTLVELFLLPAVILTGYEWNTWAIAVILPFLSLLVGGILVFSSLHHMVRQKKNYFLLLLGWSLGIPLVVFVISFVKPLFLPRYLIFAPVGLLLLVVVSLESIKNIRIRVALIAVLALFFLIYSSAQVILRTKAPLKQTFLTVKNEMRARDVVYVTNEFDFHPAQYYLPTKQVYIYRKTYEELPWFIGKILIDKQSVTDSLPLYPQRAFIVNNDGTYTVQSSQ